MSENSTLTIHTQMPPEGRAEVVTGRRNKGQKKGSTRKVVGFPPHQSPTVTASPQGEAFKCEAFPLRGRWPEGPDEVSVIPQENVKSRKKGRRKPLFALNASLSLRQRAPLSRDEARQGIDQGLARPREGESCHGEAAAQAVTERGRSVKRKPRAPRPRATFSDRLLRNSAIACAVLLGVLALGNVRQPWAQKAREGIQRALTMRIDLDDSLGELTFVRNLMPESALVFLNVSGGGQMSRPTDATIAHAWSALQPWTLFDGANAAVRSVGAGTVTAVSPLSGGLFGVLVDHGEGLESVYANLSEVNVAQGDAVNRGDALGTSGEGLYFELRSGGESVDPSERLAL